MEAFTDSLANEIVAGLGSSGFEPGCMVSSNLCFGGFDCTGFICVHHACQDDFNCIGAVACSTNVCIGDYGPPPPPPC